MNTITVKINTETMQVEVIATDGLRFMVQEALRGIGYIYHKNRPELNWNIKEMSTHLQNTDLEELSEVARITFKMIKHIEYRLFSGSGAKCELTQDVVIGE